MPDDHLGRCALCGKPIDTAHVCVMTGTWPQPQPQPGSNIPVRMTINPERSDQRIIDRLDEIVRVLKEIQYHVRTRR